MGKTGSCQLYWFSKFRLIKPGDDRFHDAVDTDSDDNEGTCAAMYI